jgi:hypothetical protein
VLLRWWWQGWQCCLASSPSLCTSPQSLPPEVCQRCTGRQRRHRLRRTRISGQQGRRYNLEAHCSNCSNPWHHSWKSFFIYVYWGGKV